MKNVVKNSNRWLRMTALSLGLLATAAQTQTAMAEDNKMPMGGMMHGKMGGSKMGGKMGGEKMAPKGGKM